MDSKNKPSKLVFFFFLAEGLVMGFFQNLGNVDKLWNYVFAENMASGLLPYRDFNYLQTPLSALINSLFLRLFGHHMLVIELLGGLLFALICWQIYRCFLLLTEPYPSVREPEVLSQEATPFAPDAEVAACEPEAETSPPVKAQEVCEPEALSPDAELQPAAKEKKVPRKESGDLVRNAAALCLSQCFLMLFTWNTFFEYSCLIVLLLLTMIRADLSALRRHPEAGLWDRIPGQLLIGFCGGCAMMSKQTFGFFAAAAAFLSVLLICRFQKRSGQETLRLLAARFAGILIPNFIFLFYLLGTGTFGDFWDMCIAGVSTFESRFSYLYMAKENWGNTILAVGAPLLILLSLIFGILWRKKTKGHCLWVILLYGVFGLINLYPMANFYHFATCLIPFLLLIPGLIPRRVFEHPVPDFLLQSFCIATALYCFIYLPVDCIRFADLQWSIPQFEGVFISDEREADIRTVTAYLEEKKEEGKTVYVLDNRASQYFLPLDDYHKYFDMFLVGNLGTTPPEELLKDAAKEGVIFLMPGKDRTEWQFPTDAVNNLKKELVKGETVGEFTEYLVP